MAHFVFLLVVEGLVRLVKEATKKQLFKEVKIGNHHVMTNLL